MKNIKLSELVENAIEDKVFPGCAIALIRKTGSQGQEKFEEEILSFGNFTYDENSPKVKEDTIYDVASITKTVSTGILFMKLLEEEKVSLDDKIQKYFPEFKNDNATIKHLLTYTLDFKNFTVEEKKSFINNMSVEEFRNNIFNLELATEPGTVYKYSDATADIQGRIIELVEQDNLKNLFRKHVKEKLGLKNSSLEPKDLDLENIAPSQIVDGEIIKGIANDPKARKSYKAGYFSGCAGLFSNAPDLMKVVKIFLSNEGNFKLMKDNQLNLNVPTNMCMTDYSMIALNEMLGVTDFSGKNRYVGKSGFTGPLMFMDLEKEIGLVFLCNRTYPDGPVNVERYVKFRRELIRIIYT